VPRRPRIDSELARRAVAVLGGRFSTELGIDVDAGPDQVERWALAATLFGARISAAVAERTYKVLAGAGVRTLRDAGSCAQDKLIALLDEGGYARYDFSTAKKLQQLAAVLRERSGGRVWLLARGTASFDELAARLEQLPGWGRVTVALFLRELRGVLPHADPPLDARAREAAIHLGLLGEGPEAEDLSMLRRQAHGAGMDLRDLEAALIRLALAHRRTMPGCPGGPSCAVLARVDGSHP
jgi:hypothetical protein